MKNKYAYLISKMKEEQTITNEVGKDSSTKREIKTRTTTKCSQINKHIQEEIPREQSTICSANQAQGSNRRQTKPNKEEE